MSAWLDWKKLRWQGKPAPETFTDTDGAFYCECGCSCEAEHWQRKAFHVSGATAASADRPDADPGRQGTRR